MLVRLSFGLVNRTAIGRPFSVVTSAVYGPPSNTGSGGPGHFCSQPQPKLKLTFKLTKPMRINIAEIKELNSPFRDRGNEFSAGSLKKGPVMKERLWV